MNRLGSFWKAGTPEMLVWFLGGSVATPRNPHLLVHTTGKAAHAGLSAPVCICKGMNMEDRRLRGGPQGDGEQTERLNRWA